MHRRNPTFRSLTLALALAVPQLAGANNLSFLDKATISKFKEQDVKLLMQTVNKVLGSADARATASWSNPQTGTSGEIASIGAFTSTEGHSCRRLEVLNRARTMENTAEHVSCQVPGRGWLLNPEARAAAATK